MPRYRVRVEFVHKTRPDVVLADPAPYERVIEEDDAHDACWTAQQDAIADDHERFVSGVIPVPDVIEGGVPEDA